MLDPWKNPALWHAINVHLPIGQATGTAKWNGAHTAVIVKLLVRHNALRGPCVTGTVTDNPSDGINPDVTVATATQCVAGTVTVTGTETPIGRYVVSLCAGAACNYVVVDMVAASAQHLTSGSWKYVSPTKANFSTTAVPGRQQWTGVRWPSSIRSRSSSRILPWRRIFLSGERAARSAGQSWVLATPRS